MKNLIKKILRESLLKEVSGVDKILDKINSEGIASLTDFEKSVLDQANTYDDMNIIVKNWLDHNYGNLNTKEQTRPSFNKIKPYILFLNDNNELVMEYDVESSTIYLPYEDITKYLGKNFDSKTFQVWFDKKYNIIPKKISNFFVNQE